LCLILNECCKLVTLISCLDVRRATGSAFKSINVRQLAKPRRYSRKPHGLSAAWARRGVRRRAFVAHGTNLLHYDRTVGRDSVTCTNLGPLNGGLLFKQARTAIHAPLLLLSGGRARYHPSMEEPILYVIIGISAALVLAWAISTRPSGWQGAQRTLRLLVLGRGPRRVRWVLALRVQLLARPRLVLVPCGLCRVLRDVFSHPREVR
jgi:hypothetical protein